MIAALTGDADGGSVITSYVIQWDAGDSNNPFTPLVGDTLSSLALSHTIYDNVDSGNEYKFNYYAINLHGDGEVSDTFSIQAANNPSRMEAPTVTLETGLLYKVSFIAPNPGGVGILIVEYEVEFRKKDSTFAAIAACDGS